MLRNHKDIFELVQNTKHINTDENIMTADRENTSKPIVAIPSWKNKKTKSNEEMKANKIERSNDAIGFTLQRL